MPAPQGPPALIAIDHPAFSIHHETGFDYATWYIGTKAEQLAGQYGFAEDEDEDIRQELMLHLIQHWPVFDSAIAKATTFIQNVIDNRVCELIRNQERQKRDYRREESLTEEAECGLLDGTRGQPCVSDHSLIELRVDCETILDSMPNDLRLIAELLKTTSAADIARKLRMPTNTLRNRIAELRERFVATGYGEITESDDTND
ncbi:MAG: sigma-70 family RNA polymerase sigma factor [Planctomycetaceae bacterium]|nr:sigma-70 family RNA polymerase sigma factor [Planctomycetaceae bacterium]